MKELLGGDVEALGYLGLCLRMSISSEWRHRRKTMTKRMRKRRRTGKTTKMLDRSPRRTSRRPAYPALGICHQTALVRWRRHPKLESLALTWSKGAPGFPASLRDEQLDCSRLSIFVRNVPFDAEEGDLKEAPLLSKSRRRASSCGVSGLPALRPGEPLPQATEKHRGRTAPPQKGRAQRCPAFQRGSIKMVADKTGPGEPTWADRPGREFGVHPVQARTPIGALPSSSSQRQLSAAAEAWIFDGLVVIVILQPVPKKAFRSGARRPHCTNQSI